VRYACIRAHEGEFEIALMCRVLQVSRSGFYAWKKRPASRRAHKDEEILAVVQSVHEESQERYGSPRVHRELRNQGVRTSRKRVARLMRRQGLRGRPRRKFCRTTDSNHAQPIAPNLLERQFAPESVADTDRVWVADITYLPTREGWFYLAVILDLASRSVVGWSMANSLSASLALNALDMAIQRRRPVPGLVHHSDRGVQYACQEYRETLASHGIRPSMSRKGDCWDNAVAESFFATLERELIDDADWHTRRQASADVFSFIEVWYNRQRLHSSLDYQAPAEYEHRLQLTRSAA
jgi:putative transposase